MEDRCLPEQKFLGGPNLRSTIHEYVIFGTNNK